jgi:23S rRNA (guanosine2251-2'-O)-methyltransferase
MAARLVIGKNSVRELLRHRPERLIKIHLHGDQKQWQSWFESCGVLPKSLSIQQHSNRQVLDNLAGSGSHQGVLAEVEPLPNIKLEDMLASFTAMPRSRLLFLDSVTDPQNFGAILRAAECFGIQAVVYPKDRSADVNTAVSKASVGASEVLPLIRVTNLRRALDELKEAGYWTYAAHLSEQAQSLRQTEFMPHSALVLGSEEKGARAGVLAACDFQVAIPMEGVIDSLNVSQAAAVFCYMLAQK